MKQKFAVIVSLLLMQCSFLALTMSAQPAARRAQQQATATQQKNNSNNVTQRALISFPVQQKMNEDVAWRRDVYREIDLTKGDNAGLYYPVEPIGNQVNLFTYMFKLMLSGQVPVYEYRLDGNASFDASAKLKPLSVLDNHNIYYEKKDGKLKIENSDIPSAEVKSYYIKESSYYDQYSATFHTQVIALCPVMHSNDDFGDGGTKYPLFWVKYDDIAPFLSKQMIMTSNINNAATMSIDDYFVKNKYKGEIYKTNNMLGETLVQKCENDSVLKKEQKRIESEMIAFEENIWGDKARKDSLDSIAKVEKENKGKKVKKTNRRSSGTQTTVSKKSTKSSSSAPASSSAARVSVRRARH